MSGIVDRLKNAPEWAKNAVAIGAVVLTILGVRLEVWNLRGDQNVLGERQDRQAGRLNQQEIRLDRQRDEIEKNDEQIREQRQFSLDIQKDLDRILEAIRGRRDDSP